MVKDEDEWLGSAWRPETLAGNLFAYFDRVHQAGFGARIGKRRDVAVYFIFEGMG